MNVDLLRVIQIGLTFSDENGSFPGDAPCTWQFHFAFRLGWGGGGVCACARLCNGFPFSLESDAYAEDSIALLQVGVGVTCDV